MRKGIVAGAATLVMVVTAGCTPGGSEKEPGEVGPPAERPGIAEGPVDPCALVEHLELDDTDTHVWQPRADPYQPTYVGCSLEPRDERSVQVMAWVGYDLRPEGALAEQRKRREDAEDLDVGDGGFTLDTQGMHEVAAEVDGRYVTVMQRDGDPVASLERILEELPEPAVLTDTPVALPDFCPPATHPSVRGMVGQVAYAYGAERAGARSCTYAPAAGPGVTMRVRLFPDAAAYKKAEASSRMWINTDTDDDRALRSPGGDEIIATAPANLGYTSYPARATGFVARRNALVTVEASDFGYPKSRQVGLAPFLQHTPALVQAMAP